MRKKIISAIWIYMIPIIVVSGIVLLPSFFESLSLNQSISDFISPHSTKETVELEGKPINTIESLIIELLHSQDFAFELESVAVVTDTTPITILLQSKSGIQVILEGVVLSNNQKSETAQDVQDMPDAQDMQDAQVEQSIPNSNRSVNGADVAVHQNSVQELYQKLTPQLALLDLVLHGTDFSEINETIVEIDVRYRLPVLRTIKTTF